VPLKMAADDFACFCILCGIALYTNEIGGEVQGKYVDYLNRSTGEIGAAFCLECWARMQRNTEGGMIEAIKRRDTLEGRKT